MKRPQTWFKWTLHAIRAVMLLTLIWVVAEGLFGMTGWSNGLSPISRKLASMWLVGAPIASVAFVLLRFVQVARRGRRDLTVLADAVLGVSVIAVWLAAFIKGTFFTVWL